MRGGTLLCKFWTAVKHQPCFPNTHQKHTSLEMLCRAPSTLWRRMLPWRGRCPCWLYCVPHLCCHKETQIPFPLRLVSSWSLLTGISLEEGIAATQWTHQNNSAKPNHHLQIWEARGRDEIRGSGWAPGMEGFFKFIKWGSCWKRPDEPMQQRHLLFTQLYHKEQTHFRLWRVGLCVYHTGVNRNTRL